jgi:hypothetical protein
LSTKKFSIHGNEPSGSNAALAVAYYLARNIDVLLSNTIILFLILLLI